MAPHRSGIRVRWRALLAALVATIATLGVTVAPATAAVPLSEYYSLESFNFPGHFARHANYLGELTTVSSRLDREDATWLLVPGLAGSGVSLRSKNYPSYYLRHSGFRLQISRSDGSRLYREDATFHVRRGNATSNPGWVSFESFNFPGRFIRHADYHLWLHPDDGSRLFNEDSTWSARPPLA
ncbi:AbfB domain-containing protein [Actinoplanes sp. NPDC023714]|uniref:AbfB domain-containing protein n=1 Tax=Actinoplanes sp. NPDC023714 TaxID=3154322 RepID=UPI0033FEC49C